MKKKNGKKITKMSSVAYFCITFHFRKKLLTCWKEKPTSYRLHIKNIIVSQYNFLLICPDLGSHRWHLSDVSILAELQQKKRCSFCFSMHSVSQRTLEPLLSENLKLIEFNYFFFIKNGKMSHLFSLWLGCTRLFIDPFVA